MVLKVFWAKLVEDGNMPFARKIHLTQHLEIPLLLLEGVLFSKKDVYMTDFHMSKQLEQRNSSPIIFYVKQFLTRKSNYILFCVQISGQDEEFVRLLMVVVQ